MSKLEEEILSILSQTKNNLSVETITSRSEITRHSSRVALALRSLELKGMVSFTGEGKWHKLHEVVFDGETYRVGVEYGTSKRSNS